MDTFGRCSLCGGVMTTPTDDGICPVCKPDPHRAEFEMANRESLRLARAESELAAIRDCLNTWLRQEGRAAIQVGFSGNVCDGIDQLVFALQAKARKAEARVGELLCIMVEAVANCETCCWETDARRCARCKTFMAAIAAKEKP